MLLVFTWRATINDVEIQLSMKEKRKFSVNLDIFFSTVA